MGTNEVTDSHGIKLRQLVKAGFMERASKNFTHLSLSLYGESVDPTLGKTYNDMKTLCTIRNASDKSPIELYDFYACYEDFRKTRSMTRENTEQLKCFMAILKLSKRCKNVIFSIGRMFHQRDAEVLLDCLLQLLNIETIKNIQIDTGFDFCYEWKINRGRTFLVPEHHIDWDFIKRRDLGNTKIDHIEKIVVSAIVQSKNWTEYEYELIYDRSDALNDQNLNDFVSKVYGKFV